MSFKEVIPGLYIGDLRAAQDFDLLKEKKVTHIFQVMGGVEPMFRNDFTYKVLDVADIPSQNLLQHLPQSTEWIGNAVKRGGRVLVHW